jgi:hypothetical protein
MIKQSITFRDLEDREVTEDHYFHLNKLELLEMEINTEGGLQRYIDRLVETTDGTKAYYLFKSIILSSHGKKTDDAVSFEKDAAATKKFEQSPALGELIFGFIDDANTGAQFVRGLLPAHIVEEVEKEAAEQKRAEESDKGTTPEIRTAPPVLDTTKEGPKEKKEKTADDFTRDELLDMSQERFDELVGTDPSRMQPHQLQIAYQRKTTAR